MFQRTFFSIVLLAAIGTGLYENYTDSPAGVTTAQADPFAINFYVCGKWQATILTTTPPQIAPPLTREFIEKVSKLPKEHVLTGRFTARWCPSPI